MISKIKYKRVLLKLSRESLLGNKLHCIDEKIVTFLIIFNSFFKKFRQPMTFFKNWKMWANAMRKKFFGKQYLILTRNIHLQKHKRVP